MRLAARGRPALPDPQPRQHGAEPQETDRQQRTEHRGRAHVLDHFHLGMQHRRHVIAELLDAGVQEFDREHEEAGGDQHRPLPEIGSDDQRKRHESDAGRQLPSAAPARSSAHGRGRRANFRSIERASFGCRAPPGTLSLEQFGEEESNLDRLFGIQPRVAMGVIAVAEIERGNRPRAAGAFGDVLAGHFEMDAAGISSLGLMDLEEAAHFADDLVERPGLVTALRGHRIAVHRIAGPHDGAALALHPADQRRQTARHLVGAEAADEGQPAGLVGRIEHVDQADQIVGIERGPAFQADRIFHAAAIFDMGMVALSRAVADPDHMAGGRIIIAGGRIDPRQRLLVAEQQCLMRGVEIGLAQFRMRFGIEADGAHEGERFGDPVGEFLVTLDLRRILDEAEHPAVRIFEIGIAAGGKGADEVQGRRRLPIGLDLAARIGRAGRRRKFDVVDDVAAIARQFDAILLFGRTGARLGELPGDAADLDDRQGRGKGDHHRHLQEDAEEVADIVGRMFGEGFGAIAALQQESFAERDLAERAFELARFAGEDERRKAGELALDFGERSLIRIDRHLLDRLCPPARRRPTFSGHVRHSDRFHASAYT